MLDVRRAQVYIESLIVEVNSAKAAEFGVQWLGLSGNDNSKLPRRRRCRTSPPAGSIGLVAAGALAIRRRCRPRPA